MTVILVRVISSWSVFRYIRRVCVCVWRCGTNGIRPIRTAQSPKRRELVGALGKELERGNEWDHTRTIA